MLKKSLFTLVLTGLSLSNFATPATAAIRMTPRQALMVYAKQGNIKALSQVVANGYKIDTLDDKGNTPLCEAVWRKDKKVVASLVKAHANLNHECMQKIPAEYKQAVGIKTVGATAADGAIAAESAEGLSTGAMVGIGVGAVAVIGSGIALAAGGGGGGSSSHTAPVVCSGHGTQDENGVCICEVGYAGDSCETCDAGYGLHGTNKCHITLACVNGTQSGDSCVCNTGYDGTLCDTCTTGYGLYGTSECHATLACVNGSQSGDSCVCDSTAYTGTLCDTCADGYGLYGTTECHATLGCVDGTQSGGSCVCNGNAGGTLCDSCKDGYDFYGTTSCHATLDCGTNKHQTGDSCKCDDGYPVEYEGSCYQELNCGTNGTQQGATCQCATGYTGTLCDTCAAGYGLHGTTECHADLTCGTNQHQSANSCVCNDGYPVEYEGSCYATLSCNEGEYQQGDTCVAISSGVSETGYTFIRGQDTGLKSYTNTTDITMAASAFDVRYDDLRALEQAYKNAEDYDFEANDNYWKTFVKGTSVLSAVSDTGDTVLPEIINTANITIAMNPTDAIGNAFGVYALNANVTNNGAIQLTGAHGIFDSNSFVSDGQVALGLEVDFIGVSKDTTPNETRTFTLTNNGTVRIVGEDNDIVEDDTYKNAVLVSNLENYRVFENESYDFWDNSAILPISRVIGINNGNIYATDADGVWVAGSTFTNNGLIAVDGGLFEENANGNTTYCYEDYCSKEKFTHTSDAVFVEDGVFENAPDGRITIDEGIGINAIDSVVKNYGTITVGKGIGIFARGGSVYNEGTILVGEGIGILALSGSVYNAGTITVNDVSFTENAAVSPYIVLEDGATLITSGALSTSSVLDLNSFSPDGTGKVALLDGGTFEAPKIVGDLHIDTSNVKSGFDTTYTAKGAIQSADATGLNLISDSHLFNASLADNGKDIVMTMKSFDSVVDNKSLASFLEKNHKKGNNEAFYNELKEIENASAFKSTLNSLTATDTIGKFAHEDLTAMRELNLQMNEKMFENNDKPIYQTQGSVSGFSFKNDNHSSANYALATKRIAPRWKVGYAMSNTTLNTDDSKDTTRRGQMFSVFAPIGYENGGWQVISTPQIAFHRAHYDRKGYNDASYKGIVEKRVLALMNEARYPIEIKELTLTPVLELNAIAYNIKGGEENKAYALTMPSDNRLSVETGIGLKAAKAFGDIKLNAGLMMYREFADPYNIKMGMKGMDGAFNLYDDTNKYRGVASFGFNYDVDEWNIYGTVQHFIESDTHTNMKAGIKYMF